MDYKALVKTVRDAGDVSAMVDHETLRDSNERKIELLGSEECLTWGMVIALCDAVEALEKDRERLDWLERTARGDESVEVGWSPAGFESDEYGGNRSSWPGGFYAYSCDMDGMYDHPTLRAAIDAAITHTASSRAPTASTPTPAAPSDA